MSQPLRFLRGGAVLGVLAVSALVAPLAAVAGEPAEETSTAQITLLDQAPWVPVGGSTELVVDITATDADAEIAVTIHERLSSSIRFGETLLGDSLGSTLGQVTFPVASLQSDDNGVRIPVILDPNAPSSLAFPTISQRGVYPVAVEVRDAATGEPGGGFITYLVVADEQNDPVGERLRVAWIWQMVTEPAFNADGTPDEQVVAEMRSDGRLGRIATSVPDPADVPVTLAAGPETFESWRELAAPHDPDEPNAQADALAAGSAPGIDIVLRRVAAGQQLLSGPFVPIDVPALVAAGMRVESREELVAGAFSLGATFETGIDPASALAYPVNDEAVQMLADTAIERLVVRPDSLTSFDTDLTPAEPFLLDDGNGTIPSAAANDAIRDLLEGGGPSALRTQRFLAALSVVALEEPNNPRGIVLASPQRWNPDSAALDGAVAGLDDHPLLAPVGLDDYFAEVPLQLGDDGEPVVRSLEKRNPGPPPVTPAEYRSAATELVGLRSLTTAEDLRIADGTRSLLVSLTSLWEGVGGRARAQEELATIHRMVNDALSLVSAADDSTVTITAQRAKIPVAFQNSSDEPVRVLVSLESEKMLFPDGSDFFVDLPPGNSTERFLVEARTSGTFPMILTVSSPDGRLQFQRSRLTVRSTAVSGVGIIVTVAAAGFLALWWTTHIVRGHRAKKRAAAS